MSSHEPHKSSPPEMLPDYPPPAYSNDPMPAGPLPPPYAVAVNPAYYPPSSTQYYSNYPQYTVGYINGQNTVVTTQPVVMRAMGSNLPRSHMVYSAFNMLFCCPLIGIAAFFFSVKTETYKISGDTLKAQKNSRMALLLNHLALTIGIVTGAIILIACIVI